MSYLLPFFFLMGRSKNLTANSVCFITGLSRRSILAMLFFRIPIASASSDCVNPSLSRARLSSAPVMVSPRYTRRELLSRSPVIFLVALQVCFHVPPFEKHVASRFRPGDLSCPSPLLEPCPG